MRMVESVAREFPRLTYDVTIKIEHLLRHRVHLRRLRDTGCLFVTSAVESFDDAVLARLQKRHTADDACVAPSSSAVEPDSTLVPTFVAFTPWTTLASYADFLDEIQRLSLVDHVAPIQLAIRLLVPDGSLLLELPDVQTRLQPFDSTLLTYPWRHTDPRVDDLCREVGVQVGRRLTASRHELFGQIWELVHRRVGESEPMACARARFARRGPVSQ